MDVYVKIIDKPSVDKFDSAFLGGWHMLVKKITRFFYNFNSSLYFL
jgi:hypothetical protein